MNQQWKQFHILVIHSIKIKTKEKRQWMIVVVSLEPDGTISPFTTSRSLQIERGFTWVLEGMDPCRLNQDRDIGCNRDTQLGRSARSNNAMQMNFLDLWIGSPFAYYLHSKSFTWFSMEWHLCKTVTSTSKAFTKKKWSQINIFVSLLQGTVHLSTLSKHRLLESHKETIIYW